VFLYFSFRVSFLVFLSHLRFSGVYSLLYFFDFKFNGNYLYDPLLNFIIQSNPFSKYIFNLTYFYYG